MKSFVVVALFVALAAAAPLTPDGDAVIVSQESDNLGLDSYNYAVRTSNNIDISEKGQLTNVGTENEALEVVGRFAYVGDDGKTYEVVYTAGVNGFVPVGDHIPQAA